MLAGAQCHVIDAPDIGIFPGLARLAISLPLLWFDLGGDRLRDSLDPTSGR